MNKLKLGVILGGIALILLLLTPMLLPMSIIPHGYDGVSASMASVEHDYDDVETLDSLYYMGVNPNTRWEGLVSNNPTGVRCSITAPQFLEGEDLDPINSSRIVYIDGVKWVEETTTKVAIMKFEMFATVQTYTGTDTYGGDTQPIYGVKFWILLQNNLFSVFGADESAIAILSVRTQNQPVIGQLGDDLDFEPKAGGTDLALHTVDGVKLTNIPDVADGSYDMDNLKALQNVEFVIEIIKADPAGNTILHPARLDCQVDFTFDVEVLLIGEWTNLRPWVEYDPPDPDLDPIDQFWEWLNSIVPAAMMFLWIFTGVILTGLAIWRLKGKFLLIVLAAIWVGVLLGSGFVGTAISDVLSRLT